MATIVDPRALAPRSVGERLAAGGAQRVISSVSAATVLGGRTVEDHRMEALKRNIAPVLLFGLLVFLLARLVFRPSRNVTVEGRDDDLRIVTLLPKDAIPSIDNPRFYDAATADSDYAPDELVLGVSFDGEARAYSTALLSGHEIVNDVVAGRPIAVTW